MFVNNDLPWKISLYSCHSTFNNGWHCAYSICNLIICVKQNKYGIVARIASACIHLTATHGTFSSGTDHIILIWLSTPYPYHKKMIFLDNPYLIYHRRRLSAETCGFCVMDPHWNSVNQRRSLDEPLAIAVLIDSFWIKYWNLRVNCYTQKK